MTDQERKQDTGSSSAAGEGMQPGETEAARAGETVEEAATEMDEESSREHEDPNDDSAAAAVGTEETQPSADQDEAPSGSREEELAEARRQAKENLDRALRAQAELENVRRRMTRDLENAHKFALERFLSELLPVKDSLELGLAASAEKEASAAGIAEGIELTLRMLDQAMEKFGIRVVDPAGEPFDPEFHQAMTMQESDTAESGTVLTVIQKGCLLNERLVRPAMVIVAK